MSEQRIDRLRDRIANLREAIMIAAMDCDSAANQHFHSLDCKDWVMMAKRLRAILEKDKP